MAIIGRLAHNNKKIGRNARLVSMPMGLSHEEEVCHLDHMVTEDQWRQPPEQVIHVASLATVSPRY